MDTNGLYDAGVLTVANSAAGTDVIGTIEAHYVVEFKSTHFDPVAVGAIISVGQPLTS